LRMQPCIDRPATSTIPQRAAEAAESDVPKQSTSTSPPPPPPALVAPPLVCWCQSSSPSDIDQVIPIWVGKCSRTKVPATSAYRSFFSSDTFNEVLLEALS
ncbi:hypothetical protein T03_8727, partial [Trichinella britovi]